ncbi:hypothetical protein [Rhizorhapis suberifaciens]|uniref:Lipoprotein n=1 Tax=Rhizorhapis suberifaciens TaxID=13656 RepID=A0A840HSM4_9SPHN|nr:hypothetical protein [Rhizorhapis suberifaciens]MBB4640568.1 hypothetical protein [Rhizorhapis suberifaciens]
MKPRLLCSLFATGMVVLGLTGCAEMFPETYHFRMTVEIDTPEGLRTGSSVYEVRANNKTALLPEEAKRAWGVKGEAVAVDLPGGRTMFALLKTGAIHGDLAGLSMTALDPAFKNDVVESAARISARQNIRQSAEVRPEDYPMLVTFRNMADPTSVARVDPVNLAPSFGAGYRLKRITVAVTDEDVTTGIEKRLGWLAQQRGALMKVAVRDYPPVGTALPFATSITETDFQKGQ